MKTNQNVSIRQPRQMDMDSSATLQVKKSTSDKDLLGAVDHRNESPVIAQGGKDLSMIDSHARDGKLRKTISMARQKGTTIDSSGEGGSGKTPETVDATLFGIAATAGFFPPVTALLVFTTLALNEGFDVLSKAMKHPKT